MPIAIVSLYAGLNALLAVALAINVVRLRYSTKTDLGHGGHTTLEQAQRAHGNLIEYVPIVLVLLLLVTLGGLAAVWQHGFGIALTGARLLHAWGLLTARGASIGRFVGTAVTWTIMIALAVLAIVQGAAAL